MINCTRFILLVYCSGTISWAGGKASSTIHACNSWVVGLETHTLWGREKRWETKGANKCTQSASWPHNSSHGSGNSVFGLRWVCYCRVPLVLATCVSIREFEFRLPDIIHWNNINMAKVSIRYKFVIVIYALRFFCLVDFKRLIWPCRDIFPRPI
jgi:hypothetical protein